MTPELTTFLSATYPDRQWRLPFGGGIIDIEWVDDLPAPSDLEQKWLDYPVELERQQIVAQAQAYLLSTDYIAYKFAEYQALGHDVQPLLDEYATQLTEREAARQRIRDNQV